METETRARRGAVLLWSAAVGATCVVLFVVAYATRDAHLGTRSLHIDDAWVLLGWKAHRWIDIRRAGSTSLGFVLLVRGWLGVDGFSYHNAQLLTLVVSALGPPAFLVAAM